MLFKRFLTFFARVQVPEPEKTTIRFAIGEQEFLAVQTVEFDLATNVWTVRLAKSNG